MRGCGHRECGNFVVDDLPDPVTYAVPAFVLLLIVEMIVSLRADKSRYSARDTLTSLMLGTGSQVAGAFVGAAVIGMSDRKSVVAGKGVSVSVYFGGRDMLK